jgi:hypothetical protein
MADKKKRLTDAAKSVEVINTVIEQKLVQAAKKHIEKPLQAERKLKRGIASLYTTRPDSHVKSFASDMIKVVR